MLLLLLHLTPKELQKLDMKQIDYLEDNHILCNQS